MSGTVRIEGGNLVFELHGVDEVLAFKRRIDVPLEHVVSVSAEAVDWKLLKQLRVIGTSIPGVVRDGTYVTGDGTMFSEMRHPDRCITVTLENEAYKRIVFEVEDKESTAKIIHDAILERRTKQT